MTKNGLTHYDRVTQICVGKLTNIDSDNGLSPGRRQAIIWTNAGILLLGPLGTNFSEFLIVIHTFSFNKMHLKMSSAKWRPFCLGLNVLSYVFSALAAYDWATQGTRSLYQPSSSGIFAAGLEEISGTHFGNYMTIYKYFFIDRYLNLQSSVL